jgi:pyruvate/2-oxoglutarate dehydrogenase complex dihydrolipoamide dehydrogenase (E3) component
MDARTVDVVVIGAGAVGENVADRAHRGGMETALVEAELVGGECSFWACMPSKALLRPAEALAAARAVPGAREAATGTVDVAAALAWRTSIAHDWDDSSQVEWVEGAGLTLVRGRARFTGERELEVTAQDGAVTRLTARHAVVVATGSTPVTPPVDGLAETPHWSSRDATSAREIPSRLVVLGGGVVGSELSQAFATLGSEVTLISRGGLLAGNEPFAGEMVTTSLRAKGVTVLTGTELRSVAAAGDGVVVTLPDGTELAADRLLVATGRRPHTADLGLETIGLEPGKTLEVDDTGRVTAVSGGWLYAAGDVNGRALLTHQGKYQARAIGDVVAARANGTVGDDVEPWSPYAITADHAAVPAVVFTSPQVAAVGLTAAQARERFANVRVVDIPIAVAGCYVHSEDYDGRAVMVVDEDRKVVVGVTFVGDDVQELLHSATIAVVGEVPLPRLWHAVPSYPTISEVWLRLLESYGL